MALIIRLRQQGTKNKQTFRLVVTDKRSPRDGKYIENLGWYNPLGGESKELELNVDRIAHWLDAGAQVSEKAKSLIRRFSPDTVKNYSEKDQKKRLKLRKKEKKAKPAEKPKVEAKPQAKATPKTAKTKSK